MSMRNRVFGSQLSRDTDTRKALFRSLVAAVVKNDKIVTTKAKAKSVQGFIDAIHHQEDGVHIIDYKTNSSFDLKDENKLQLAIYSLLYLETHGKLPSKVGIFFLRHKLKLMAVDEQLLELAKKEIMLIHAHTSATEKREDYPKTVNNLCKWSTGQCDFYKTCKPHETKD